MRLIAGEGGWFVIFRIFVNFVFCQLNFIVLFPFRIKYYHILFSIIVFRLGSDKLSPVSSTVFPKGSVTGCVWLLAWGGWMDGWCFIFEYSSPFCFLLIQIHYAFSISYIVLTCYVYYYCIWQGFNTLFSCFFLDFYCSLPWDQSRDVTPRLVVSYN